jgi:hypothetical protein
MNWFSYPISGTDPIPLDSFSAEIITDRIDQSLTKGNRSYAAFTGGNAVSSGMVGFAFDYPAVALRVAGIGISILSLGISITGLGTTAAAEGFGGLQVLPKLLNAVYGGTKALGDVSTLFGGEGVNFKGITGFFGEIGNALSVSYNNANFRRAGYTVDVLFSLPSGRSAGDLFKFGQLIGKEYNVYLEENRRT